MKIENIDLLELFVHTICSATIVNSQQNGKLPYEQSSTLAQQLGNHKSIFENMAKSFERMGEHSLAEAMQELELAMQDEKLWSPMESESHKRLLKYVYPVV